MTFCGGQRDARGRRRIYRAYQTRRGPGHSNGWLSRSLNEPQIQSNHQYTTWSGSHHMTRPMAPTHKATIAIVPEQDPRTCSRCVTPKSTMLQRPTIKTLRLASEQAGQAEWTGCRKVSAMGGVDSPMAGRAALFSFSSERIMLARGCGDITIWLAWHTALAASNCSLVIFAICVFSAACRESPVTASTKMVARCRSAPFLGAGGIINLAGGRVCHLVIARASASQREE